MTYPSAKATRNTNTKIKAPYAIKFSDLDQLTYPLIGDIYELHDEENTFYAKVTLADFINKVIYLDPVTIDDSL